MYIYKITNLVNGKVYIGKTIKSIQKRFGQHKTNFRTGKQTQLYNAMRKYGIENFIVQKVCKCINEKQLEKSEIFFIKFYDSIENGYNVDNGTNCGSKVSEEGKLRISIANKGKTSPFKGKKHTEEAKRSIALSRIGKNQFKNIELKQA